MLLIDIVINSNYCFLPLAILIKSEFEIASEQEENLSEIMPVMLYKTLSLKSRKKEGKSNLIL